MEKDTYKAKYLQESISMLTEENLELLEKHCIKNRRQDIGRRFREHEIVFELIQAYKEQQAELEKKDKIIDEMADSFAEEGFYSEHCQTSIDNETCLNDCNKCVKQYFERKVEDVK